MASFSQAVSTCLVRKIFNWHDRAPRSEYWWFIVFEIIACPAAVLIGSTIRSEMILLAGAFFCIYLLWAAILVTIRRLHDKDMSGWWVVLMLACYGVGSVGLFPILVVALVVQIFFFIMLVSRGTVGPNRFGPDPLLP